MTGPALLESQRVRQEIRAGRITGTSRGLAHGFVQCNLAILPKEYAFDFLLYCGRNQRSCPVLEVTDAGSVTPKKLAPTADLRTDCARYAIYRDGVRNIALVMGHDFSLGAFMVAARELATETNDDLRVIVVNWLPMIVQLLPEILDRLPPELKKNIPPDVRDGHGGGNAADHV